MKLKYRITKVLQNVIPCENSLCIYISGSEDEADKKSQEFLENPEKELNANEIDTLLENNLKITCMCFIGGDINVPYLISLAAYIKSQYPNIKVAWYSNQHDVPDAILGWFRYVKVGPYIQRFGDITKRTTNQKLYEINSSGGAYKYKVDVTNRFWK